MSIPKTSTVKSTNCTFYCGSSKPPPAKTWSSFKRHQYSYLTLCRRGNNVYPSSICHKWRFHKKLSNFHSCEAAIISSRIFINKQLSGHFKIDFYSFTVSRHQGNIFDIDFALVISCLLGPVWLVYPVFTVLEWQHYSFSPVGCSWSYLI